MGINKVKIENFTVFKNLEVDFSNGINVIIGENGTGKTHLLKLLYSMINCNSFPLETISHYFLKEFRTTVFNLIPDLQNDTILFMESDTFKANKISFYMSPIIKKSNDKVGMPKFNFSFAEPNPNSVYIPVKDMLTHSKGFLSLYDKFNMPFDKTYYDIISNTLLPQLNEKPNIAKNILPLLEKMMDGKVVVKNDTFYVEKTDGRLVDFDIEAEGYKKIALLWQLLMTDNITKDSILLWDEPEANINPKFIPDLVEILLALSRNGVQIFLSTHSYIFAKYFEVRQKSDDNISFHSLYRENDNILCESSEKFKDLKHNVIMDSFEKLLDEVYDNQKGE